MWSLLKGWSGKLKAWCSLVSGVRDKEPKCRCDTLLGFTTPFIAAWSLTFFLLTLLIQMSLGRLCSAWFVQWCLRAGAAWASVFTLLSGECAAHGCPQPFSKHKMPEQISRNNSKFLPSFPPLLCMPLYWQALYLDDAKIHLLGEFSVWGYCISLSNGYSSSSEMYSRFLKTLPFLWIG